MEKILLLFIELNLTATENTIQRIIGILKEFIVSIIKVIPVDYNTVLLVLTYSMQPNSLSLQAFLAHKNPQKIFVKFS